MVTLMMLLLPIALVHADAFGLRIGEIVSIYPLTIGMLLVLLLFVVVEL